MKKNGLNIIIIVLIVLIVIVSSFLLFDSSQEEKMIFELYGEEYIYHNLGSPFFDPGVKAIENGVDVSKDVIISGDVKVDEIGVYTRTYKYKDLVLTRQIEVKKLTSFALKGESDVYIVLNGKYDDPKVEAYYNGVDAIDKIKITGNVDYSKSGVYIITYTFEEISRTLERKIHISDFSEYLKIDYPKEAVKELDFNIQVDNTKVLKYLLPDGTSMDTDTKYHIDKNGNYKFTIYDKYNNAYERIIDIENIDKEDLSGSCVATVKDKKTTITVKANKPIIKYKYNGVESTKNPYVINSVSKNNRVIIYDLVGNTKELTCSLEGSILDGNMEIHFIASGFYDDSILIRTDSKVIYIDGGRAGGAKRDIEYLKGLGVKKIDAMIGSHVEFDHIEAQADILDNFSVDKIIYPVDIYKCRSNCQCQRDNDVQKVLAAMKRHNKTATTQPIPSKMDIGEIKIYYLGPLSKTCNNNNNSFVFILKYGNTSFMFTGDSYSSIHNPSGLLDNAKKIGLNSIKVDVMKYPHHGNDPMYDKTLNAISPKIMIVPNYKASKYPSSSNINRIKQHGITMYRQSDSSTGNLTLISDGEKVNVYMNTQANSYKR